MIDISVQCWRVYSEGSPTDPNTEALTVVLKYALLELTDMFIYSRTGN